MSAHSEQSPLERNILDLGEAIHASQMVVTYCTQRRIMLDKADLRVLVEARYQPAAAYTAEFETKFWLAFNRAMDVIAPVTIESLAASLGTFDFSGTGENERPIPARLAVRRYRWGAVAVLLILIVFQGYTDWGRLSQADYLEQRARKLEIEEQMGDYISASADSDEVLLMADPAYRRLIDQRNAVEARLASDFDKLRAWCFSQATAAEPTRLHPDRAHVIAQHRSLAEDRKDTATTPAERRTIDQAIAAIDREEVFARSEMEASELLVTAGLMLTLLQAYLLPLLYGLLGAWLHVLRRLRAEVETITYSPASDLRFRVQLALGTLAGMSVGWLLAPETSEQFGLSSFAFAFVAGYSVEVLFKLLDGILARINFPSLARPTPELAERSRAR